MIKLKNHKFTCSIKYASLPVYVDVYQVNNYILAFVDKLNEEIWFLMDYGFCSPCDWSLYYYDYETQKATFKQFIRFEHSINRLIDLYNAIQKCLEN